MEKKRLLELAGMRLNEEHPRSLDELNGLSDKYLFSIEDDKFVVHTKNEKIVGAWDNLDTLIESGFGE